MLHEAGVGVEGVALAVLQNEEPAGLQQGASQDKVGQGRQLLQLVGRVGKDQVEGAVRGAQEAEHVGVYGEPPVLLQLAYDAADEGVVVAVLLDGHHPGTAAGHQLEADAARAGKEVEGLHPVFLEVIVVGGQYIEEVLLGKVRGGTCLECAGHVEVPPLVDATDYSHRMNRS